MDAQSIASLLPTLQAAKGVAVLSHMRPDGDSIGSQVALCRLLIGQGVKAFCLYEDTIPAGIEFVVGDTPLFHIDGDLPDADLCIHVDCADAQRVGERFAELFPKVFLNIDHHPTNTEFAEHNLVVADSPATAEVIAELADALEWPIDAQTAQALYVGIATDTGQFCYEKTTRKTFEWAGRLMSLGADPAHCARKLYQSDRRERLELLQRFLATMQFFYDGKIAVAYITGEMYEQAGGTKADTEGFVNYLRNVEGVVVGVLIESVGGRIKVSMRGEDPSVRLDLFAQARGGGGHAPAAGLNAEGELESFLPSLVEELTAHLQSLGL